MILMQMASSSFHMSPHQAIWTHFKLNPMTFVKLDIAKNMSLTLGRHFVQKQFASEACCSSMQPKDFGAKLKKTFYFT